MLLPLASAIVWQGKRLFSYCFGTEFKAVKARNSELRFGIDPNMRAHARSGNCFEFRPVWSPYKNLLCNQVLSNYLIIKL